jgi:hypothetical protein
MAELTVHYPDDLLVPAETEAELRAARGKHRRG